ncbi:hypothetical protein BH20ACI4_BH20ACI4_04000 [soil metagenome]
MADWKLLTEEEAARNWNKYLNCFSDCSPFQTYEFGQSNKDFGWLPVHLVAFDKNGKPAAMMLGLMRRFPFGFGFMWCVGGPVGAAENWSENLPQIVREIFKLKHLYFRFRCDRARNIKDVLTLYHKNWMPSFYPMTSGLTMKLDISRDSETIFSELSGKWRRNLRLARKNDITVKRSINPDIDELRRIFDELEKRKGLPPLFSSEKLETLFKHHRGNLILFRGEDGAGDLLSFRGVLVNGNQGCDFFAATGEKGRKMLASYIVFWDVLEHCRDLGVTAYDLGGIDPFANRGVYTFKKETGAKEVELLGEWDWASSFWLRLVGNLMIWKKQNFKNFKPSFNFINKPNLFGRLIGATTKRIRASVNTFLS